MSESDSLPAWRHEGRVSRVIGHVRNWQGMGSGNGRRRYVVTSSLTGWVHTKKDPWNGHVFVPLTHRNLNKTGDILKMTLTNAFLKRKRVSIGSGMQTKNYPITQYLPRSMTPYDITRRQWANNWQLSTSCAILKSGLIYTRMVEYTITMLDVGTTSNHRDLLRLTDNVWRLTNKRSKRYIILHWNQ